ncbi:MAG TPA: NlpC/P60 family protein [Aestuariivirgaceae bacterium]|jgi:NlpC/P60 family putative phage cell wall peptidase
MPVATETETLPIAPQVIAAARSWIGTPYRHQASLKLIGADCLGLVRGIYRELYCREPEPAPAYSADWAEASAVETMAEAARRHLLEIGLDDLAAGDVALFRWRDRCPAKHAAIMTSATTMVHAQRGSTVCEIDVTSWWRRRVAFAFRFPERA